MSLRVISAPRRFLFVHGHRCVGATLRVQHPSLTPREGATRDLAWSHSRTLIIELDPQETVKANGTTSLDRLLRTGKMAVNAIDCDLFHLPSSDFVDFPLQRKFLATLITLHPRHGRLSNRAFGALKLLGVVAVELGWRLRSPIELEFLILRCFWVVREQSQSIRLSRTHWAVRDLECRWVSLFEFAVAVVLRRRS